MEENDQAFAALVGGDDRRAVLERGPGFPGEIAIRFRENLAAHPEIAWDRETEERALTRERRQRSRRIPRERAAEAASAAPQAHRHEVVVAGGEPRPREADEKAAALDELRHLGERLAVERADIGEDKDGDLLVEQMADGVGCAAPALAQLGIRRQGARQVIGRREQRLRLIGGRAGDEPDAAALAALVEQRHGSGRALSQNLDADDGVPDIDRQVEARLCLGCARRERKARVRERQIFWVERAQGPGVAPVRLRPHDAHGELARGALDPGERKGRGAFGLQHRERAIPLHARQAFAESLALRAGDAVADPDHLRAGRSGEEALDGGEMRAPIRKIGLRLHGAQPVERRRRGERLDVGGVVGGGEKRHDAPAVALRRIDALQAKPRPVAPVVRRREAVVHDDQERALAAARDGVPDRSGRGEDEKRRDGEPHQQQPPRRPRGRLALRQQVEQDAQRRKVDPARLRRRDPQQQPDRRQRGQGGERQRRGEGEGKAQHQAAPAPSAAPRAADTSVRIRNAASLAGRSVRWIVIVQPRRRVKSASAPRCRAMRSR